MKELDFISFRRVVRYQETLDANGFTSRKRNVIVEQSGSGMITRLNKTKVCGVRVARVDAGPWLGTVSAVLDDAETIGQQQAMV